MKHNFKKGFTRTPKFGVTPKGGGFTLIELLVVVAIIGVLASVVLASLNSARNKGSDSVIKSNLANIRSQAELIYAGSGCYGDGTPVTDTTCADFGEAQCGNGTDNSIFKNPIIWSQIQSATSASGAAANGVCSSEGGGARWATAVLLKDAANSWCVDSTGTSRQVAGAPAAAINAAACQ